jgi:hypothetical protein
VSECTRLHWIGQAEVYDDGRRIGPSVRALEGRLAEHGELDDRCHYFAANEYRPVGVLRVTFWGHDRDAVLAAVQERYTATR